MIREVFTKIYNRINWRNRSEAMTTALGKTLLNRMDYTLDELDSRSTVLSSCIIELDNSKLEESEANELVKDWRMDLSTYIVTVTKKNGTKTTFDLGSTYIAEIRKQVQAAASSAGTAGQYKNAVQASAEAAAKSETSAGQARNAAEGYAVNARSWSDGDTGTREGEATDCAKYYSERSKNSSDISKLYLDKVEQAGNEAVDRVNEAVRMNLPAFSMDFETGHLMYSGGRFIFKMDDAGHMRWRTAV